MEDNKGILPADRTFNIVMYDVKEMAAILGVSTRTIMEYIYKGKLKCVKVGRKWKITKDNLEAFCTGRPQV